jgi:1-acyl-sn-glycerol-3-phosphate acyltransferase
MPTHPPIAVPICAPQTQGRLMRWFATRLLRTLGWRIVGELPNVPKVVIIAAPHSSAWDAVLGLLVKMSLGLRIEFMIKQELFWWPLSVLLYKLGGCPINRSTTDGVVDQFAERMRQHEQLWLVLAPEGTRRRVEHWKNGFWRIATTAKVPVLCAYFHYPEKIIGLGPCWHMTDDLASDMRKIRDFYKPWQGKNRGTT